MENLLRHGYGKGYTFSALVLLYPTLDYRNRFHIDHIHPRSKFSKRKLQQESILDNDIDLCLENVDLLPNLQLLEGIPNQEKSDTAFADWLKRTCRTAEDRSSYMKRHFIPNVDLSFSNFTEFVKMRKALMKDELRRILLVNDGKVK